MNNQALGIEIQGFAMVMSDFKGRSGAPYYANELFGRSHALQGKANEIAGQSNKLMGQLAGTQREMLASHRRLEELTQRVAAATERTAVATERQNIIGMAQLSVAETQAAIAAKQLELANVQSLERRRQTELKQAAFALNQTVEGLAGEIPTVRLFYLYEQQYQVESANVVAENAEEIADKNYIRETLRDLQSKILEDETTIGPALCAKYKEYYYNVEKVDRLIDSIEELESELTKIPSPGSVDLGSIISRSLSPPFASKISGTLRIVILFLYYIYLIFVAYGFVLFLTESSRIKASSETAGSRRAQIESRIMQLRSELAVFEGFFNQFTIEHRLP